MQETIGDTTDTLDQTIDTLQDVIEDPAGTLATGIETVTDLDAQSVITNVTETVDTGIDTVNTGIDDALTTVENITGVDAISVSTFCQCTESSGILLEMFFSCQCKIHGNYVPRSPVLVSTQRKQCGETLQGCVFMVQSPHA